MKIRVDKENKCVIAIGSCKGKRVKVVTHCKEEKFDENFGIELTKKKYKIKKETIKKELHDKYIKKLHETVLWCFNQIKYEEDIVKDLAEKIRKETKECNEFINEYFKTV